MSTADQNFVKTLEAFNQLDFEVPADNMQISGWSEEFQDSDVRKSLLSVGCSRLKQILCEGNLFSISAPRKYCKPVIKKCPNNRTAFSSVSSPKRNQYLNKRLKPKLPKQRLENSLDISPLPMFKISAEKKTKSISFEKKHLKLEEYYEKNFLIVKKCPPVVSGYSATLYHK